jgi:hypothetical protein
VPLTKHSRWPCFQAGDQFRAVSNGKWKKLTITESYFSGVYHVDESRRDDPRLSATAALWMTRKAISKHTHGARSTKLFLTLHQEHN